LGSVNTVPAKVYKVVGGTLKPSTAITSPSRDLWCVAGRFTSPTGGDPSMFFDIASGEVEEILRNPVG